MSRMTTRRARVGSAVQSLVGAKCWHVGAGGLGGGSFSLALGSKVRREHALRYATAPKVFQAYEGEFNLVVWCSWRLDGPAEALASSDEDPEVIARKLRKALVGRTVERARVSCRACELRLVIGGYVVSVFCDHVPGQPSFDGNWQLETPKAVIGVGPGFRLEVERRHPGAARAARPPSHLRSA